MLSSLCCSIGNQLHFVLSMQCEKVFTVKSDAARQLESWHTMFDSNYVSRKLPKLVRFEFPKNFFASPLLLSRRVATAEKHKTFLIAMVFALKMLKWVWKVVQICWLDESLCSWCLALSRFSVHWIRSSSKNQQKTTNFLFCECENKFSWFQMEFLISQRETDERWESFHLLKVVEKRVWSQKHFSSCFLAGFFRESH